MPTRAAADRPSRRLDAVLTALRKHGVTQFAGQLPGLGDVRISFGELPETIEARPSEPGTTVPVARRVREQPPPPLRDELELVTEEHGPIEANGVS
jgi:hypothetical protein